MVNLSMAGHMRTWASVCLAGWVLLQGGCSAPADVVGQRSKTFLTALSKNDSKTAMAFVDPQIVTQQGTTIVETKLKFAGGLASLFGKAVEFEEVQIKSVKLDDAGTTATVNAVMLTKPNATGSSSEIPITQTWVLRDGTWYVQF